MVNISNELGNISITSEVFTNIAGAAATRCSPSGARSGPSSARKRS